MYTLHNSFNPSVTAYVSGIAVQPIYMQSTLSITIARYYSYNYENRLKISRWNNFS